MDALVLDLADRSATRANDLWLREERGSLSLRAADVSPWAVLRRLGRGVLGRGADRSLLDWRDVEFLRGDPRAAQQGHDYHRRIASLPATEIAHLAEALPYLHAAELLTLIPDGVGADTLEAMSSERQLQVFEELDEDQAARILALMAPDIAADLLGRLEPQDVRRWLNRLPPGQSERVTALLRYPEDTAGGIMTNDVIVVPERLTLPEARDALREPLAEPDFVYYVYAVDDERSRRLRGVLSLRELLIGRDDQSVSEVMRADVLAVDPRQSALEAAQLVADNGFAALPCVGPDGRLLGAITIDAAMEQLAPPSWRRQAPRVFS
jgi:Mg/Co/Ni transporter MgtE